MILDTKKSNFASQEWVWFQIWFTIMTLRNHFATDYITKCNSYFTTKYNKSFLKNTSRFLL